MKMNQQEVRRENLFRSCERHQELNAQIQEKQASLRSLNKELREVEAREARLEEQINSITKHTTRGDGLRQLQAEASRVKARGDALEQEMARVELELQKLRAEEQGATVSFSVLTDSVSEAETLKAEGLAMEARLASASEELAKLELSIDLNEEAGLVKLASLHALCSALPKRIQSHATKEQGVDVFLLEQTKRFVGNELASRARKVETLARTRVKNALRDELDGDELAEAVERSTSVKEANGLLPTIEDRPNDGAIGYAKRMLEMWQRVEAFEANLHSKRRAKVAD